MKKYKLNISEEPHCNELESLGSILIPIMKNIISTEDLMDVEIILNWVKIVGKDISKYCNPLKTKIDLKNNSRTLYVEVPVGGFALEIQHQENYLLDKINSYIGYKAIHKINITQNANMKLKTSEIVKKTVLNISEEDEKYLSNISSTIEDDKLKEILIKIGKDVISTKGSKQSV